MRQIKLGPHVMTLTGNEIKVGDKIPAFTLRKGFTPDSSYTQGSDEGKVRIFNVLLSVNTGVCDRQTRKFNDIAASLGEDVVVITVSIDLPPTMATWCAAAGVDKLVMASDYYDRSFSQGFGIWVKEAGVPARAVIVVDKNGRVAHMQVADEFGKEPDYETAVEAARTARG
jgi:thiol peroxidase